MPVGLLQNTGPCCCEAGPLAETTTDWGTELGISDYRIGHWASMMPHWLQPSDLHSDVISVDDAGPPSPPSMQAYVSGLPTGSNTFMGDNRASKRVPNRAADHHDQSHDQNTA